MFSIYNFYYHTINSSICCVCITEYVVWYRDDSQPEIDEIPRVPDYRSLTLDELVSATHGLTVTHMCIWGDIPPIDEIAPHIKQLELINLPDRNQSDRSASLIIHQYHSLVDLRILLRVTEMSNCQT